MHPEFHDFTQPLAFSALTSPPEDNPRMRSNGMVFPDRASGHFRQGLDLTRDQQTAAGFYLLRPEDDDYTPYRVTCRVSGENTIVSVGFGRPPTGFDASVNGTPIFDSVVLASGLGQISFDEVVCIPAYTLDLPVAFFVSVAGRSAAVSAALVQGSLTVERMIGAMPRFYDRRIG